MLIGVRAAKPGQWEELVLLLLQFNTLADVIKVYFTCLGTRCQGIFGVLQRKY